MMIRRFFDGLYAFCGALAGLSILAILVLITAQVVARLFGIMIPSADEFAGYALEASTFLGLAYSLRQNAHIRINILLQALPQKWRRPFEIYALFLGIVSVGYFTWYAANMVWVSYEYSSVSIGLVAIPLWIPQSAVFLGSLLMTIALIDELIFALQGNMPTYVALEQDLSQAE